MPFLNILRKDITATLLVPDIMTNRYYDLGGFHRSLNTVFLQNQSQVYFYNNKTLNITKNNYIASNKASTKANKLYC